MAASSLADVIGTVFEGRESVTPVIAGSSTLVAQLAAGADADVLITANAATMEHAVSHGSVHGEPVLIALNTLVLATRAGNPAWRIRQPPTRRPSASVALFAYSSQGLSPSNPRVRR